MNRFNKYEMKLTALRVKLAVQCVSMKHKTYANNAINDLIS